jgi:hypothetical protein
MAERKMTEVANPNEGKPERLFAKFDAFGDFVEGHMIAVEEIDGKYGPQTVYDFIADDGGYFTVSGSADIKAKLDLVAVGVFVRLEYAMDRAARKEGRSPMKVFKVQTDTSDRWSDAKCAEEIAAVAAAASGEPGF